MVARMNATSSAATIGLLTNHSVAFATVHCLGRGAVNIFPTATLLRRTSCRNSFAVIFRVVGRRAALHGRFAGLNVALPSSLSRPKLNNASAFNELFCETYILSENVSREGAASPGEASSSIGLGGGEGGAGDGGAVVDTHGRDRRKILFCGGFLLAGRGSAS